MVGIVLRLIDSLLVCGTVVVFAGMGFLFALAVMALDKPENLGKLLTIVKEHFNAYFSRD